MAGALKDEEIAAALARLPGWQQGKRAIRRTYAFENFREAMKFVHRVADLAEAADHHPDIEVSYREVTLTLWTHSIGAVTDKDLDLAGAIDG